MNRSIPKDQLTLQGRVAQLRLEVDELDAALAAKKRPKSSQDFWPILLRPKLVTLRRLVHITRVALSHLEQEIEPCPNSPIAKSEPVSNNLKGRLKGPEKLLANNGQG